MSGPPDLDHTPIDDVSENSVDIQDSVNVSIEMIEELQIRSIDHINHQYDSASKLAMDLDPSVENLEIESSEIGAQWESNEGSASKPYEEKNESKAKVVDEQLFDYKKPEIEKEPASESGNSYFSGSDETSSRQTLRTWLIFLLFCFYFELLGLEYSGFSDLDPRTKAIVLLMGSLVILMTLLVIYSFYNKHSNTLFITSVIMQFTFILCDLKTTHHASSETNHHVVRNACSARLILMALETSHITSLAIETSWMKYFMVNFINLLMFTMLVFMEVDTSTATFWDLGQIGSIFASAIASLIIYHHLVERINGQVSKEKKQLTEQKESFKQVAEGVPNGIIIVQDGKINYVNKICNIILSTMLKTNNLFERTNQKSIIDKSKLLDKKIFKLYQIGESKNIHIKGPYSLRDILIMPRRQLENKIFTFTQQFIMNAKDLCFLNDADKYFLPNFKEFQFKKISMRDDEIFPSFVLCIIDQSQKVLADNSIKGEKQLVALINSTISHEMRNPLNVVSNQCGIINILCTQFMDSFNKFGQETSGKAYMLIKEFYDSIKKSNLICANSSEILTLNIEDLLSFAHLKSNTFFKNNVEFNIQKTIKEIMRIQQHQSDSKNLNVGLHFFDFPSKSEGKNKNKNIESEEEISDFKRVNMMVKHDQLRIKQVLMNLFSNATKFTKEKGEVKIICQYVKGKDSTKSTTKRNRSADIALKVQDKASKYIALNEDEKDEDSISRVFRNDPNGKNKIIISVVDSGIGMDKKERKKIFKMFGYLNKVEQDTTKGIGIGLCVSEQIVKAMGGDIGFKSSKGIGSQFSFSIVLDEVVQPSTVSNETIPSFDTAQEGMNMKSNNLMGDELKNYVKEVSQERNIHQTGKILVVDDEQYNLDILQAFFTILKLKDIDDRVTFCNDGEIALKIIQESAAKGKPLEYSLILSDCSMPFMDGYEATRQMRDLWDKLGIDRDHQPLIYAVTGHIEECYIQKAMESGMDHVYSKPLEIKLLANLLQKMKFIDQVADYLKMDQNEQ